MLGVLFTLQEMLVSLTRKANFILEGGVNICVERDINHLIHDEPT